MFNCVNEIYVNNKILVCKFSVKMLINGLFEFFN